MEFLVKIFGSKDEGACCAVEIKEVKSERDACCTLHPAQETTADEKTDDVHVKCC